MVRTMSRKAAIGHRLGITLERLLFLKRDIPLSTNKLFELIQDLLKHSYWGSRHDHSAFQAEHYMSKQII